MLDGLKPHGQNINTVDANPDKKSPSIMKAYPVPRRFIVERDGSNTHIVFGFGLWGGEGLGPWESHGPSWGDLPTVRTVMTMPTVRILVVATRDINEN